MLSGGRGLCWVQKEVTFSQGPRSDEQALSAALSEPYPRLLAKWPLDELYLISLSRTGSKTALKFGHNHY